MYRVKHNADNEIIIRDSYGYQQAEEGRNTTLSWLGR